MRNMLALRRLSSDAPALGSEEKLRFLRSWLLGLATALASVFEPLGREDTHPRVRQLMLDRLAQPQFWNVALTIATRQHAQLLHMHDTLEELETGTESLATAQWFGRSGPSDWPLRRLKVHIPAAAMAYLCDAEADASGSGGGVALKGTIQSSRGMRFVMAGGLKAGHTPPIFVEPHRHLLLQSAGPPLRLSRLLRPCGGPNRVSSGRICGSRSQPPASPLRTLRVRHMSLPTAKSLPFLQPRPCLMWTLRR